jgi:DNA-binding MarR family transcriptional regulator
MTPITTPLRHGESPAALLDLLQCLTRALRDEARQGAVEHGLLLVHWQILWFLRAANRYSNTVQTLVAYLGQTKGSVSKTVQLLESRGLIVRRKDNKDKRVVRLELTNAGKEILDSIDVGGNWQEAASYLSQAQVFAATEALTALLGNWQRVSAASSFGVCRTCSLFCIENDNQFRCGLTLEPLSSFDSGQICQAHKLPK